MTARQSRIAFGSVLLAFALALPASAALSPWYDRAEQIQTILSSEAISNAARQAPIEKLEYEGQTARGTIKWEVDAGDCDLDVYLIPEPPSGGMVGKTTYRVEEPIGRCD